MTKSIFKTLLILPLSLVLLLCSCTTKPMQSTETATFAADTLKPADSTAAETNTSDTNKEDTPPSPEGLKLITDIKSDSSKVKIACIGDSITAGTGITDKQKDSYPAKLGALLGDGYEVGNFGIGGSYILPADNPYNKRDNKTLSYMLTQQYKDSVAFEPDIVLIMLGTNDALSSMVSNEAIDEIQKHYEALINTYKALPSVKRVYVLSSILSVQNIGASMNTDGTLQAMQQRAAEKTGCEFVNTFPYLREYYDTVLHTADRLHPNDQSSNAMPKVIFDLLTKGESEAASVPVSESSVVFVSSSGKLTNDGKTP